MQRKQCLDLNFKYLAFAPFDILFLFKNNLSEKRKLDRIVLKNKIWKTFSYDLSVEIVQYISLLFKVSRTWNPKKFAGVSDPRNLGVPVGKISFKDKD